MGRPISKKYIGANAVNQVQATVWGTNDTGATKGYLAQQNSPRRFRTKTTNGTSTTSFVNGAGNLVSGTSYVNVFPQGSYVTTPATANATLGATGTATVVNGGSGYAVNDYVHFVGGTAVSAANVKVTAVSGNVVTAVSAPVQAIGAQQYSVLPSNIAGISTANATGNGHGLILSSNFGLDTSYILTGGAGYTAVHMVYEPEIQQPTITEPTVSGGAVTTGAITVTAAGIINQMPTVTVDQASGTTEYVKTLTSQFYLNTFQGNQYRWFPNGANIPSNYSTANIKIAYLDTL